MPGGAALLDERPQFAARYGVYAHARLVQQQELGIPLHGTDERELLSHATGKLPGPAPGEGDQACRLQELLRLLRLWRNPPQPCGELHIFGHGEILIQAEPLRHVADFRTEFRVLLQRVFAQYAQVAPCRAQQSGHGAQQSGFARAIGPDKPQHFAGVKFQ